MFLAEFSMWGLVGSVRCNGCGELSSFSIRGRSKDAGSEGISDEVLRIEDPLGTVFDGGRDNFSGIPSALSVLSPARADPSRSGSIGGMSSIFGVIRLSASK